MWICWNCHSDGRIFLLKNSLNLLHVLTNVSRPIPPQLSDTCSGIGALEKKVEGLKLAAAQDSMGDAAAGRKLNRAGPTEEWHTLVLRRKHLLSSSPQPY